MKMTSIMMAAQQISHAKISSRIDITLYRKRPELESLEPSRPTAPETFTPLFCPIYPEHSDIAFSTPKMGSDGPLGRSSSPFSRLPFDACSEISPYIREAFYHSGGGRTTASNGRRTDNIETYIPVYDAIFNEGSNELNEVDIEKRKLPEEANYNYDSGHMEIEQLVNGTLLPGSIAKKSALSALEAARQKDEPIKKLEEFNRALKSHFELSLGPWREALKELLGSVAGKPVVVNKQSPELSLVSKRRFADLVNEALRYTGSAISVGDEHRYRLAAHKTRPSYSVIQHQTIGDKKTRFGTPSIPAREKLGVVRDSH